MIDVQVRALACGGERSIYFFFVLIGGKIGLQLFIKSSEESVEYFGRFGFFVWFIFWGFFLCRNRKAWVRE